MNLEKEGSVKRRYTWRDSEGFDVKGYLKGHPLFKDIEDEDFLSDLSHETNTRIFDHGDFLFRKGDIGKAMILILKGEVDILDSDGKNQMELDLICFPNFLWGFFCEQFLKIFS